jgi:hypothetical protein
MAPPSGRHASLRPITAASTDEADTQTISKPKTKKKEPRPKKPTGEILSGLWKAIDSKPLREDTSLEAVALMTAGGRDLSTVHSWHVKPNVPETTLRYMR